MADTVRTSGPLFDGRADRAINDGLRAVRQRLAREAEKLAVTAFASQIRDDHGRFERSITSTDRSTDYSTRGGRRTYDLPVMVTDLATDIVVTTDLATYGPWLEGTGSRNETTRFKGYHGFRRAGQQLNRIAGTLAQQVIAPYVARCD